MTLRSTRVVLALLGLGAACGRAEVPLAESAKPTSFRFSAIDADERPVPAMVVLDGDWIGAAERRQFVNVVGDDSLVLGLTFTASEVEVTMVALRVEDGVPTYVPRTRLEAEEFTSYVSSTRRLRADDPSLQLFALTRR